MALTLFIFQWLVISEILKIRDILVWKDATSFSVLMEAQDLNPWSKSQDPETTTASGKLSFTEAQETVFLVLPG